MLRKPSVIVSAALMGSIAAIDAGFAPKPLMQTHSMANNTISMLAIPLGNNMSPATLNYDFLVGDEHRRFAGLVAQWKRNRNPTLLATRMVAEPAYREIIQMGPIALPWILKEMSKEPDEWFYALAKISGENPIADAQRGRFSAMTEAWLNWGKQHGYL